MVHSKKNPTESFAETSNELYAVVPAAGIGSRMGADIPKQYLTLQGQTILQHTLAQLSRLSYLQKIMVPISSSDQWFDEQPISKHEKINVCVGGRERFESVLNGLNGLVDQGVNEKAWVMVHDVARPCVFLKDIEALFQQRSEQGAILALEVRDTMKRTDANGRITNTVERDQLWHALTPQLAPLGVLRDAIVQCISDNVAITDEASALEYIGLQPKVVAGHPSNIKVTRPEDLELAEFFLSHSYHSGHSTN